MTRQYQELQKQTAAHSQRLEAKVKSLQEQLGMALASLPVTSGMGMGFFTPGQESMLPGGQGEAGDIHPVLSAKQQLKAKLDPIPSVSLILGTDCKGDAVIPPHPKPWGGGCATPSILHSQCPHTQCPLPLSSTPHSHQAAGEPAYPASCHQSTCREGQDHRPAAEQNGHHAEGVREDLPREWGRGCRWLPSARFPLLTSLSPN